MKVLVMLSLTLCLPACGSLCREGPDFKSDYRQELSAALRAAREVVGRSELSREDLEAIPVVPVVDIDLECGSDPKGRRTIACFCETPLCREILISEGDVGHERTHIGHSLMADVLLHEYVHAVLPSEAGHGQLFGSVRARAREIRGLKDPWTWVQEQP